MCITNAFGRFAPPNIDVCVCVFIHGFNWALAETPIQSQLLFSC